MAALSVRGSIRVPGDKSISHRALMLSALANGRSRVRRILDSADTRATADALRALGATIPDLSEDFTVVSGGSSSLVSPRGVIDCANSGTSARLLAGIVAGLDGVCVRFEGDESLSRRPMRRVASPLTAMGAAIEFHGDREPATLPMTVCGAPLRPITWDNPHASAQVKSAILLAGLVSGAGCEVLEPSRSRDHTERMLAARGVTIDVRPDGIRLAGGQTISPLDVDVPGDPSSAAFFLGFGSLVGDADLTLRDVGLNPTRTGAIDVLTRMGARVDIEPVPSHDGEPRGALRVRSARLTATRISGDEIPRCIDELPLLACVAAYAEGVTEIADAQELRVKESDRIRAVVINLRALGVEADETPDGMRIRGGARPLRGSVVTHGDHRLAMAFGVLAQLPGNDIRIDDPDCVAVSYPDFWADLRRVTA